MSTRSISVVLKTSAGFMQMLRQYFKKMPHPVQHSFIFMIQRHPHSITSQLPSWRPRHKLEARECENVLPCQVHRTPQAEVENEYGALVER
jgi:hypothetical protein